MVQVLPPLHIRGTCRIQRLPDVSVMGPTRMTQHGDDGFAADNNLYVQMVHEENGLAQTKAAQPLKQLEMQTEMPQQNGLQITVTSTDSYEPNPRSSSTSKGIFCSATII